MKKFGKFLMAAFYLAIPVFGWYAFAKSFLRVKPGEISSIRSINGGTRLIEAGVYCEPFPGSSFGPVYNKSQDYINFGQFARVRVKLDQIAYKTNTQGALVKLEPGIHMINTWDNERFDPATGIQPISNTYTDFGPIKIVRIKEGQLGVKTDGNGVFVELQPGNHIIDTSRNESFNPATGIQDIGQEDFVLGNKRYITIRNGELGESYKKGLFCLLEPGRHTLPAGHVFVKKVSIQNDVVDLGAYKIITVKEGQVAVINTPSGVIAKGPGKHEVKQDEGNFFNAIITTCPQGVVLPPLTVMCSDQIEMQAESMLIYKVNDPLKTVGLGITAIIDFLKVFADGTLRTILSRFSSADIAPSLHTDEQHDSARRTLKLNQIHDDLVSALDGKARDWGLGITDLQITKILPADGVYHETIRKLGTQQSTAEANKRLAENDATIAGIRATAENSKVVAAEIAQRESIVRAETEVKVKGAQTTADANREIILARAKADAIKTVAEAESFRIQKLSEAARDVPVITQQIMLLEAQSKVFENVKNPVFVQPDLGSTTVLTRENNGLSLFSSRKENGNGSSLLELAAVNQLTAS
jgi:regulator of protease activity HflC (stomatin/prohibitin superfamily)